MDHNPLFCDDYLLSRWEPEYRAWLESGEDDALRDRLRKWADRNAARITGTTSLFENEASMRAIISTKLYGVDITPESVEITQLALWLNTALPGKPISNLAPHIPCDNSIVAPDTVLRRGPVSRARARGVWACVPFAKPFTP